MLSRPPGRKGPFTEIAAGPLQRGEPLSLTFMADDLHCFIELKDWSSRYHGTFTDGGWGVL
jgi:hypothetical protein